jgi:hypothetical protein
MQTVRSHKYLSRTIRIELASEEVQGQISVVVDDFCIIVE